MFGNRFTVRHPVLAPLAATAALCLVFGFLLGRITYFQPGAQDIPVSFHLEAPRAQTVSLAGDFTGWDPVPLEKHDNEWALVLPVHSGERYRYALILNGKMMIPDPNREEMVFDQEGNPFSILDTRESIEI
ncbi:hypothetical protein ACFL6Y_02920 [Elusimicrobiota bacterium]